MVGAVAEDIEGCERLRGWIGMRSTETGRGDLEGAVGQGLVGFVEEGFHLGRWYRDVVTWRQEMGGGKDCRSWQGGFPEAYQKSPSCIAIFWLQTSAKMKGGVEPL